jgi:hypothetical protein
MQNGKTHFEQVPMEVAENALRLQPIRPKPVARGSPSLRSAVRIRVSRRRSLAWSIAGSSRRRIRWPSPPGQIVCEDRKEAVEGTFMRQMTYISIERSQTWACSDCAWTFNPSGPPRGNSLEEMKQNYERQRDKEYASHVCAEHPRAKSAREGFGTSP